MKDKKAAEIINKLPKDLQDMIDNPLMDAEVWSEEWHQWAKRCLYELTMAREKGFITEEERSYLHENCFRGLFIRHNPPKSENMYFYIYG